MSGDDRSRPSSANGLILEAWSQGLMVGSLLIMAAVAVANMRKRILLHKLIVTELILGIPHGIFIFAPDPIYSWFLAATATTICMSWSLHNIITWMKNRPFLSRKGSIFYIGTVILVQPYWVVEIYANFTYFININNVFQITRPMEPIFRDPWWVFTTCHLFYIIRRQYSLQIFELVTVSPRFGILLVSMCLSLAFTVLDACSVVGALPLSLPKGAGPFWRLSFIFKCLCDIIILDDFKAALDRIRNNWLQTTLPCNLICRGTTNHNETLEDIEAVVGSSHESSESTRTTPRAHLDSGEWTHDEVGA